jgi:hypothetical protein
LLIICPFRTVIIIILNKGEPPAAPGWGALYLPPSQCGGNQKKRKGAGFNYLLAEYKQQKRQSGGETRGYKNLISAKPS